MAWVDRFGTWRRDLEKRLDAGQDVAQELLAGADGSGRLAMAGLTARLPVALLHGRTGGR